MAEVLLHLEPKLGKGLFDQKRDAVIDTLLQFTSIFKLPGEAIGWTDWAQHTVDQYTICVDYYRLNTGTQKDAYPLPRTDDMLELMRGAEYFATLDPASSYWQVAVMEADWAKTAFCTHHGLIQFWVMPFALCKGRSIWFRYSRGWAMSVSRSSQLSASSFTRSRLSWGMRYQDRVLPLTLIRSA